jgi:phosphoribosylformimino-5-aminoimidazole carboxamide ribotide isomerase
MEVRVVPLAAIWQMRQQVMYLGQLLEFVQLENDQEGVHLGMYDNEILLSVISLFRSGQEMQFRKFATKIECQRKGIGSALLKYVMDWTQTQACALIWCNARTTAMGLYKRFGMEPVGETWVKNGIEYIKMQKAL